MKYIILTSCSYIFASNHLSKFGRIKIIQIANNFLFVPIKNKDKINKWNSKTGEIFEKLETIKIKITMTN